MQSRIARLVHLTHAPSANEGDDLVRPELGTRSQSRVLLAAIIETPWANNLPKTRARAAVRATKRDEIGPVSSGGVRPFRARQRFPPALMQVSSRMGCGP